MEAMLWFGFVVLGISYFYAISEWNKSIDRCYDLRMEIVNLKATIRLLRSDDEAESK